MWVGWGTGDTFEIRNFEIGDESAMSRAPDVGRGGGRRRLTAAAAAAVAVALLLAAAGRGAPPPCLCAAVDAAPPPAAPPPGALPPDSARPFGGLCDGAIPSPQTALDAVDLLRDSLEPDLAPWRGRRYARAAAAATAAAFRADVVALVEFRDGELHFLDRDDNCESGCNPVLVAQRDGLRRGLAARRLRPPEGVPFVFNVGDDAVCPARLAAGSADPCRVPVLSVQRRERAFRDVLAPNFQLPFAARAAPWAAKAPRAFFRGSPYCNGVEHRLGGLAEGAPLVNCSRLLLAELSAAHPTLLNASILEDFVYEGRAWRAAPPAAAGAPGPHAPPDDLPNWQFLLNLDGYGASTRLQLLLATNSLVLKQESVFVEHYYRSLRPCVHYLPFFQQRADDVIGTIAAARADAAAAQAVAANAQAFALVHLTDGAKWAYWEEALRGVAALMEPG